MLSSSCHCCAFGICCSPLGWVQAHFDGNIAHFCHDGELDIHITFHIGTGTAPPLATSAPGLPFSLPHLHRDQMGPPHQIRTRAAHTPVAALPHLHRDQGSSAHICTHCGRPLPLLRLDLARGRGACSDVGLTPRLHARLAHSCAVGMDRASRLRELVSPQPLLHQDRARPRHVVSRIAPCCAFPPHVGMA